MSHAWFGTRALDAQTWAIDDRGADLMYLLCGRDRALLIDTGWGVGDLAGLVSTLTPLPLTVVVTHGHPDHVGGAGQFPQVAIGEADRTLALDALDPHSRGGALELGVMPQPLPAGLDRQAWLAPRAVFVPAPTGGVLDLGGRRVEAIALPGHTPGGICYVDRESRHMFTGDSLLGLPVWMHLDESLPLGVFLQGLCRLCDKADACCALWPGHGRLDDPPLPCGLLDRMIEGIRDVVEGRRVGTPARTFVGDGLRCDFGGCGVLYRADRL
jgi:hydroxyacylglutathione hydrolase